MATVQLGSKTIGSTVKIKVNGALRDFIVAFKGSPSTLYNRFEGTVTLLQRDIFDSGVWGTVNNDYSQSALHPWLNNTYFNQIEEPVRSLIPQVQIPYRAGDLGWTITSGTNGLPVRVFAPSAIELGLFNNPGAGFNIPNDGTDWGLFGSNGARIAYSQGNPVAYGSRTPGLTNSGVIASITVGGGGVITSPSVSIGIRPVFPLPVETLVTDDGTVIVAPPPAVPTSINYGDPRAGEDILITLGF